MLIVYWSSVIILLLLFGWLGTIANAQTASLSSTDSHERARAIFDLSQKGAGADVIATMVQMLGDSDTEVRTAAADSLGVFRADARGTVHALIPLLRDPSENVRDRAAHTLGLIGPAAADAIPSLIPLLFERSYSLRWMGVQALGAIGNAAAEQRGTIAALGNDENEYVRGAVVETLSNLATHAEEAMPYITAGLRDPSANVRRSAATAIVRWNSAPGMLLLVHTALADSDWTVQSTALGAIFRMPQTQSADFVDDLITILDNPDNHFGARSGAADALASIGEPAKTAAPDLRHALSDPHEWVQRAAARALRTLGLPREGAAYPRYSQRKSEALELLVRRLSSKDEDVRIAALREMANFNERVAPYSSVLMECLKTGQREEKRAAIDALGGIRHGTSSVIPAILAWLDDPELRPAVLRALQHMGPGGAPAVPALIKLLPKLAGELLHTTIMTLGEIGEQAGTAALPLSKLLNNTDVYIRRDAIYALNHMWASAAPALPALFASLKDEDAQVRGDAAFAIGQVYAGCRTTDVPPLPAEAGARIVALLKDERMETRERAAYSMAWARPVPAGAVTALIATAADDSYRVRSQVEVSLGKIGGVQVTGILVHGLADPSDDVRTAAAWALGEMKAQAQVALPALRTAVEDPNAEVRRAAMHAVDEISKGATRRP